MVIKIFAGPAEGKTTIATWITEELRRRGIEVSCEDLAPEADLEERFKVMGNPEEPLKIEIKTIPYGAESRPGYAKKFRPYTLNQKIMIPKGS